jgi:iron uptake system EfeUOB component EfeO/EfeM
MKTFKKSLLILLFISFYSASHAGDLEEQINKACLRHAVSLVTQLKSEVIDDLSQSQSDQALKIATETCQAYFNKEFNQNSSETDLFTEKILNGDSSRKKGNERLRRKK